MMLLKKNDLLVDLENESHWMFACKTRGPDLKGADNRSVVTWTCVLTNRIGERRFIAEAKMATLFKRG